MKNAVLDAIYALMDELSIEEVEDLKDALTIREHALTDDGERIGLEEVVASL